MNALIAILLVTGAPDVAERVKVLLSGFEKVPTAEEWAAAVDPAEVAQALVAVANGDKEAMTTRARAVSALGFFARPEVHAALDSWLRDQERASILRRKAALAYEMCGVTLALPALRAVEKDPDDALREVVTGAIARLVKKE
jgi:hypothetical protein